MPTYEFTCEGCKKQFVLTMSFQDYDQKKVRCPKCKGKRVRQNLSDFFAKTSKKS